MCKAAADPQCSVDSYCSGDSDTVSYFIINYLPNNQVAQYRHLFPAPVDRTSASAWLYQKQMGYMSIKYPKHVNNLPRLRFKATFSCELIHASMPRNSK